MTIAANCTTAGNGLRLDGDIDVIGGEGRFNGAVCDTVRCPPGRQCGVRTPTTLECSPVLASRSQGQGRPLTAQQPDAIGRPHQHQRAAADYSTSLTPASFTTLDQRPTSDRTKAPNSSPIR